MPRRTAADRDVDERGETRDLVRRRRLKQGLEHRSSGGEALLRLDMADAAQPDGGTDEPGDQRPAREQFGRTGGEAGIAKGELPPLFVIGAQGDGQLVNYRFRSPYYIVDRLFGAAELRLGADKGDVVRIERTDGWPPTARRN